MLPKKIDNSRYTDWAFVRATCLGRSVLRGINDQLAFSAGEVIPVLEDCSGYIVTQTADGVERYVSKNALIVLTGYTPFGGFLCFEDASVVVTVATKLFLRGKSVFDLPPNSQDVFDTAAGVIEKYFLDLYKE